MYNNEVTYDPKWNTEENQKALDELNPLLEETECWSDCPLSWAQEVLVLIKELKNRGVHITQVKEKYGELRVYHSGDEDIDKLIYKCEIELAKKGAYYSLDELKESKIFRYDSDGNEIVTYPYKELLEESNV